MENAKISMFMNQMDTLRIYGITNQNLVIKLLGEFYHSLNQGKNFLRTPHCLTKNLEKIKFLDEALERNKENIEVYINSIIDCHPFLEEYKKFLKDITDEDYIKIFTPKELFNQEIDRGQYDKIALFITQMLDKSIEKNMAFSTSEIISKIFDNILKITKDETCFDFTYGKGALALQVGKEKISGMEINQLTQEMGNLFLNIANKKGQVLLGDSLEDDFEQTDVVISDPPFGLLMTSKEEKEYLQWGNPLRVADLSFLSLAITKAKSRGAIVVPQGVLFRGGNEEKIRENIIKEEYIEGIISLPNNIMNYISIPVSIIFFRKDKRSDKIFMLDTTKDFFKKIRGGVTINDEDLEQIIKIYTNFTEVENISRFVTIKEILENKSVLTVGKYMETKTEKIDITVLKNRVIKNFELAEINRKESNDILKKLMEE
ncbi:N-6 DNA methylase [Fusobacterium varium]